MRLPPQFLAIKSPARPPPDEKEPRFMDDPGPESFGDQADLPRILETKQKAAIAFHKANQDLALRAAAKMNSLSVTGFYTGSLKLKNLTPSGGEDLLWSLQLRPASTKRR